MFKPICENAFHIFENLFLRNAAKKVFKSLVVVKTNFKSFVYYILFLLEFFIILWQHRRGENDSIYNTGALL